MKREQQGKMTTWGGALYGERIIQEGDYTKARLYREKIIWGEYIYGK